MKIVTINGQNHKGSTYKIGRMLAEKLTNSDNIQEIFLPKDLPSFCCGCLNCVLKGEDKCPHYDYVKPLTELLDNADVLIFTSPVYVYHVTGPMKNFLDHYAYRWLIHRPENSMFKKQAVCIATAAGAGMKSTCKDIKDSMDFWGIAKTYRYGTTINLNEWEKGNSKKLDDIKLSIDKLAMKIVKDSTHLHSSVKTKVLFSVMRKVVKSTKLPVDFKYWQENGWDKKSRPWKK